MTDEPRLFDFHCHLDLLPEPAAAMRAREERRIFTVAVTTTPRAWPRNRQWSARLQYVRPALGLHPELVAARGSEIRVFEELAQEAKFVGEIGLDGGSAHRASWDAQQTVLRRALGVVDRLGGRVVSLHSRQAARAVLAILEQATTSRRVLPILHWFTDSPDVAEDALKAGCYFSINPRMLNGRRGREVVRLLPLDRILTETDAPFGTLASGADAVTDLSWTLRELAAIRSTTLDRIEAAVAENARRVLVFTEI